MAVAKALAMHGAGGGEILGVGKKEADEMDMDGEDVGYAGRTLGESSKAGLALNGIASTEDPTAAHSGNGNNSDSLNQALTLMQTSHNSFERQLADLKASNEMLWRQAMLAREEQVKSQKKLDSVMRFLAGQFGGLNMALLGGEEGEVGLGGRRMIGDGIVGMDDGMDGVAGEEDDEMMWEMGDDGGGGVGGGERERDVWEVDDSGKMIKVQQTSMFYLALYTHISAVDAKGKRVCKTEISDSL